MKTALWRRVSTDDYYIVKKVKEGYFLEGTQNHDKIDELWEHIKNSSSFKGYFKCRDISELSIVGGTKQVFDKILNKHIFTDLNPNQS